MINFAVIWTCVHLPTTRSGSSQGFAPCPCAPGSCAQSRPRPQDAGSPGHDGLTPFSTAAGNNNNLIICKNCSDIMFSQISNFIKQNVQENNNNFNSIWLIKLIFLFFFLVYLITIWIHTVADSSSLISRIVRTAKSKSSSKSKRVLTQENA